MSSNQDLFHNFEDALDVVVNSTIADVVKGFMPGPSDGDVNSTSAYYEGVRDAVKFIVEYNDWLEA